MKHISFLLFAGVMFFSCNNKEQQKEVTHKQQPIRELTKLEQLYLLPKYFVYDFYDLSNLQLSEIPDLSEYTIKKLDLSYNRIDSFIQDRLPQNIEKLNLSNNFLSNYFRFEKIEKLSELNISNNQITYFYGTVSRGKNNSNKKYYKQSPVKRLNISNNNLDRISFGGCDMSFLDISNNPKLSNEVFFDPKCVDTIIRNNIANTKPLIYYFHKSFTID